MIPREILKKIRQIEIRTNRLVTEALADASLQPPAQFLRIACAVPNGQNFNFVMSRVDGEVNRVRPRRRNLGFARQPTCESKTFRFVRERVKNCTNRNVKPMADSRFALVIPHHSFMPIAFGVGLHYDRESHFLARSRSSISAKTCSTGFPRPGCFNASSARRSSSAICSSVSSSANSSSIWPTSSRRSASGIRRICSRISVALTRLSLPSIQLFASA